MALNLGDLIEFTLKQSYTGANIYNVFLYKVTGFTVAPEPATLAEAWWNHVKAQWRALILSATTGYFLSITAKDPTDPTGFLAEYAIPVGEQGGTRSAPTAAESTPTFVATGVRYTVGTRVTRPGQKRFFGAREADLNGNDFLSTWLSIVDPLASRLASEATLGAPELAAVIQPVVGRRSPAGLVIAHQDITGYVLSPKVTSQVSRKVV